MLRKRLFPLFLIMLFVMLAGSKLLHAQVFGGNPGNLKWKQINTDTARIVFAEGLEPTASRVAAVVHELQKNHHATIGSKTRKINIVLQNQNLLSNGYVGLGPYRSEFYLVAPQNSFQQGSLNWADKLTLHEYRHVQQYSNFNVGLAKVASIVLGQEGQAVANAAAVPDYFFEGDAVFNETVLSRQGRGRQPMFFNGYQALYKQNRTYSYMKLRNGSFKHFVPDHYALGYMLTGYGREKYGTDFWQKVSRDAARFRPLVYPWQGAVKRHSGVNYKQFVADAFSYYQRLWQQSKGSPLQYLSAPYTFPTDYKYPYAATDGALVVLKRGYRQVPAFYRVSMNGSEEKIAIRDIAYDDYFSYNNNKIVYSFLQPDKRWGYREYSNIRMLDVQTGITKTITRGERFFSPDISHSGQQIAAVEMKTNQLSNIIVMDTQGKRLYRFSGEPGVVYTYPKFSANDSMLYTAVRNGNGEMALQQILLSNSSIKNVLPFANRVIGFPTIQGDTVFFTSTYKGSDEVWAYLQNTKTLYRVAVHPTGLYQAVFISASNQLVSSAFTADGYRLVTIDAKDLLWQQIDDRQEAVTNLYLPGALRQHDSSVLNNIAARDFAIAPYRKTFNIFNFHSWRPSYDQPEFSYTLFGQNVLNTLLTEIGYTYNRNEKSHKASANLRYGGWYVQPYVGVSQTWDRTIQYNRDTTLFYNEKEARFGLSLPLNFSGGKQYRFLTLNSSIHTNKLRLTGLAKRFFNDRDFNYVQQQIFYSGQVQKATQQIYPHWAQTFLLQHRTIINEFSARQFLANATFYLPGLHNTHNIVFNAAYAGRDTMGQYFFSNNFPFSRGYTAIDFPRMWRFGANYHLPLAYPDFGLAQIVYFRRVRANGFYDYTQTKSMRTNSNFFFATAGAEIYFDTRWWNQQNVTFGVRYSRLLNNEYRNISRPNQWELILPINLLD